MKQVIDVSFWFKELFLAYKYCYKKDYEKAMKLLKPYVSENLYGLIEEVYEKSLWVVPWKG